MRPMSPAYRPALLAAIWLTAAAMSLAALAPAQAQTTPPPSLDDNMKSALQTLEKLLSIMKMLSDSLPAYEAPEILPNGDILIRRRPNPPPATPAPAPTPPAPQKKT